MVAPYLSKLLNSLPSFKRIVACRLRGEDLPLPLTARNEPKPAARDLLSYYPRPFMRSVPPARRAQLLEILASIEQESAHRPSVAKVEAKR